MLLRRNITPLVTALLFFGCVSTNNSVEESCLLDESSKRILADIESDFLEDLHVYEMSISTEIYRSDTLTYLPSAVSEFFEIEESEFKTLKLSDPVFWCGLSLARTKTTDKRDRKNVIHISVPVLNAKGDKAFIVYYKFAGYTFILLEKENEVWSIKDGGILTLDG